MTIIKKTTIQYHNQPVEIVKDIKPNPFSKNFTPGYSWRFFDCESYYISKKAFGTPEEAEENAKTTIEKLIAQDNERQKESEAYRTLQRKVFATQEEAEKEVEHAVRYTCDECGNQFWAMWRSKYSENPTCGTCEGNDMTGF